MKNKILPFIIIGSIILILIVVVIVVVNTRKTTEETSTTTTTQTTSKKMTELQLEDDEKPYISLIPSTDGHTLTLKITDVPSQFSEAEYEIVYTAQDEDIEIEKGVSGNATFNSSSSFSEDVLLGTASCTNGCKYKYDEGVTGGTVTITFKTDDNQYSKYEGNFILVTGADINEDETITIGSLTITGTANSKTEYFIALKNFTSIYSIFSSGTGKGSIDSIEPSTITKSDTDLLTGDYIIGE